VADLLETNHPQMSYYAKFHRCWSKGTSIRAEISRRKIGPFASRPAFHGHSS